MSDMGRIMRWRDYISIVIQPQRMNGAPESAKVSHRHVHHFDIGIMIIAGNNICTVGQSVHAAPANAT